VNEAEKNLSAAASESLAVARVRAEAKKLGGFSINPCDASKDDAPFAHALDALLKTESAPAVVEPEALRKVREAWEKCSEGQRYGITSLLRAPYTGRNADRAATENALADLLESAPVEGGEYAARLECALGDAKAAMSELATVKDHRDKLSAALERIVPQSVLDQDGTVEGMERWIRDKLTALRGDYNNAKREAEAMRDLATKNANELNAAVKERDETRADASRRLRQAELDCAEAKQAANMWKRDLEQMRRASDAAHNSYRTQLADLQRALESEKKAHGEALAAQSRPERDVDRELREAFRCSSSWSHPSARLLDAIEKWYAAPLSAPDAPVSTPPTARVLECWVAEYADGNYETAFKSPDHAFMYSDRIVRAHKVALPVIETVERGA
jgi:hypothetical protein